jgi:hypothetical protein
MRRIPIAARAAALAAVVIGAGVAYALPAGADVSILSPSVAAVQVGSPATVDAKGAVLAVSVTTVCARGASFTNLSVDIVETVGGGIAHGSASLDGIACTGGFNTVDLFVFAQGKPFHRGTGFAKADFVVCDFSGCRSATDQREIRIVR